jgi:hypothetical protein
MRCKQIKDSGWRLDRAGVWHYVIYELVVFGYGHPKERRRVLCGMRGGATYVPAGSCVRRL